MVASRPLLATALGPDSSQQVGVIAGRLVVLTRRRSAATIAAADATGRIRSRELPPRSARSGLAASQLRAYLVGPGSILDVDVGTLAVREYRLSVLQPATSPGEIVEVGGDAVGDGLLALSVNRVRRSPPVRGRTFGVYLVDTRRWIARLLDRQATSVRADLSGIVVSGPEAFSLDPRTDRTVFRWTHGGGVTGYARSGQRLWHRFGNRAMQLLGLHGGRACVAAIERSGNPLDPVEVLDLRSGRTVSATTLAALARLPVATR